MVMVEIDSNAILVEPINSRNDHKLARAYRVLMTRLQQAGIVPKKHILNNEVSKAMKTIIKDEYKMAMELVPPGCHRRNAAEVAIRNFKAHFLSVLAGAAEDFPPSLWDRLLPQTEITLNLLRQSNATPTVSAYTHLCGPFDYNKMPLAPMGCAVQVHEKTDKRGTWAYHSVDGWYLSTSPKHYRTHRCHIKATKSERVSDTLNFSHKNITRPTITHTDKVMNAIATCAKAITNITSSHGAEEMRQLVELTEQAIHQHPTIANLIATTDSTTPAVPRVRTTNPTNTQSVPRVQETEPAQRTTRVMAQSLELANQKIAQAFSPPTEKPTSKPTTSTSTLRWKTRKQRSRVAAAPSSTKATSPAANTRSKTKADAPPATRTRASTKKLGNAAAVAKMNNTVRSYARRLTKKMELMENEIHQAMAVMDEETGQLLNYRQLLRSAKYKKDWSISSANEFGRLANGVGNRIKNPTNTIQFVRKKDIPQDRRTDVTYGSFVCSVRPEKKEKNRTRFTVGGDRINYPGAVATPKADMLVAKLLFNSVISTKGAQFMTIDISDFYLMTPLKRPEFIRISINDIPEEIIIEYKLREIADSKGMVYIQANQGMYGLPQSGLLVNELLEKRLNKRGYHQSKLVPGLWSHKWRPVQFTLVIDDFGVKYVGKEHALHLKQTLEENYKVTLVHRHHLRLGLQVPTSPFIHAWIHQKGSQTIQA